jgi:hypothetical protein
MCSHCNDTGSLTKDLDGYLDCTHCDIAEQRTELEQWVVKHAKHCDDFTAAWLIFQHGKAAAAVAVGN